MEDFIKNISVGVIVMAIIYSFIFGLIKALEYYNYSLTKILTVILLTGIAYIIGLILRMILENKND